MRNFHIKSIVLGIGIGIILTSIISIIYMLGEDPAKKISDEEIIKRAEKLGMVKSNAKTDTQGPATGSATPTPVSTPSVQPVTVTIEEGDLPDTVADKLFKAGLISEKNAFIIEMTDMELTKNIVYGTYKITPGMSNSEIIRMITGTR